LAQLFPKSTNLLPLFAGLAAAVAPVVVIGGVWYYGSPWYTDVGYRPHQPVPYSHALHAGELGIDCRYCHASVEQSAVAVVPPTATCMNCHHVVKRDSPLLAPLRESEARGRPLQWVRVHNLPDYAYFHHAAHVRAGVGCASCHGAIQQMDEVTQTRPLSMSWCLDCHRDPAPNLRPPAEVTNMEWLPPKDHAAWAEQAVRERGIAPPVDCSGCHR
jgi:hypothetical protein